MAKVNKAAYATIKISPKTPALNQDIPKRNMYMGESKCRGSKEERVAQATGLKKQKLDEIKKEIGIPENAEFCGYLIQLPEKGEFVQSIEDTPLVIKRSFVNAPELAMRFTRFWDANKYTKEDKGEIVVGLFDIDGQFLIRPVL